MTTADTEPEYRVFACHLRECPTNRPVYLELNGHKLVVVRAPSSDRVYCADCHCPHAGANPASGEVSQGSLVCPQHHLKFDLSTGECESDPDLALTCYRTRVENGKVYVYLRPKGNRQTSRKE